MIKKHSYLFASISVLVLSACQSTSSSSSSYTVVDQENMTLFPTHSTGNIGDVMPFYHEGEWNFFYLHDSPPNPGFHPWYRFSTQDFTTYEDHGEVIDVIHDLSSQELALGTGSVIEKDGAFYAFYTAHNGRLVPKEMFKLSISTDGMDTWNKHSLTLDPRTFGFDVYDFRDPHVVFVPEENLYYMLFTTRYAGLGAIGYLVSETLLEWSKVGNGIFFLNNTATGTTQRDSNLECPTLWFFNGYWYLTYSDQKPDRQTHYLYKKDFHDDWIRPTMNRLDSKGLYAGKVAASDTQMILGGWVSSDFNRSGEFAWAGSLIAHELKQHGNGTLYVDMIEQVKQTIKNPQPLRIEDTTLSSPDLSEVHFTPSSSPQNIVLNTFYGISRLEGTLSIDSIDGYFGLFFDYRDNESSYHYDIHLGQQKTSFYRGHYTQRLSSNLYTTNSFFNTSSELKFTLLFEDTSDYYGSIVTLYIEGQVAHTARMFRVNESNVGFYSLNSKVTIHDLVLYR
jgi:beta-fructofuranosidase